MSTLLIAAYHKILVQPTWLQYPSLSHNPKKVFIVLDQLILLNNCFEDFDLSKIFNKLEKLSNLAISI